MTPPITDEQIYNCKERLKTDVFSEPFLQHLMETINTALTEPAPDDKNTLMMLLIGPEDSGIKDLVNVCIDKELPIRYIENPADYTRILKEYEKVSLVETLFCMPKDGMYDTGEFRYASKEDEIQYQPVVETILGQDEIYGDFTSPTRLGTDALCTYIQHMYNLYRNFNKIFDRMLAYEMITAKSQDNRYLKIQTNHPDVTSKDGFISRQCMISHFIREEQEYAQELTSLIMCFLSNLLL